MFNIPLSSILNKVQQNHVMGKSVDDDLHWFIGECKKKIHNINEEKIKKAFLTCVEVHQNQVRKSGLPAYTHALAVAEIVVKEIPLDEASIIAALLHDSLNSSAALSPKDIKAEFGTTVADIIEGISTIDHIETQNQSIEKQIENYRKLLLSLFHDIRIILIKIADRLHNMRTLEHLSPESQQKLAQETLDIYAQFANRFGLRNIKWELEDLSFKYLNKEAYEEIKNALKSTREEREDFIDRFLEPINQKLAKDEILKKLKIHTEIKGRPKHLFSIYNKMNLRQKKIDELYDLFAIRVIVDTDEPAMCFFIYGLISSIYQPVPETFKDYISSPKKNGYKSIHTAVVGPNKKIVEVQIRTKEQHLIAENGFAAHFRYKSGTVSSQSILEDSNILEWLSNVRNLLENTNNQSNEEIIESLKSNLFFDEIYVYTTTHEFISLPKDSTPLDFAFEIDENLGLHYVGAKVQGKIVPIDYRLKSGDQVDILTSQKQKPVADWLKYCVTNKAKFAVREALQEELNEKINQGILIWSEIKESKQLKVDDNELIFFLNAMKIKNLDDFYLKLFSKEIDLDYTINFLTYKIKEGIQQNSSLLENNFINHFETISDEDDFKELNIFEIIITDRPNLLNEVSNLFLSIVNIQFIEISYKIDETKFEIKLKFKIFSKSELKQLIDSINLINGLQSLNFLEN